MTNLDPQQNTILYFKGTVVLHLQISMQFYIRWDDQVQSLSQKHEDNISAVRPWDLLQITELAEHDATPPVFYCAENRGLHWKPMCQQK